MRRLVANGVHTVLDLEGKHSTEIEAIMGRNPPFGKNIKTSLAPFPRLGLVVTQIGTVTDEVVRERVPFGEPPTNKEKLVTTVRVKVRLSFTNTEMPVWEGKWPVVTLLVELTDGTLAYFWRGSLKDCTRVGYVDHYFPVHLNSLFDEVVCHFSCEEIVGTIVSKTLIYGNAQLPVEPWEHSLHPTHGLPNQLDPPPKQQLERLPEPPQTIQGDYLMDSGLDDQDFLLGVPDVPAQPVTSQYPGAYASNPSGAHLFTACISTLGAANNSFTTPAVSSPVAPSIPTLATSKAFNHPLDPYPVVPSTTNSGGYMAFNPNKTAYPVVPPSLTLRSNATMRSNATPSISALPVRPGVGSHAAAVVDTGNTNVQAGQADDDFDFLLNTFTTLNDEPAAEDEIEELQRQTLPPLGDTLPGPAGTPASGLAAVNSGSVMPNGRDRCQHTCSGGRKRNGVPCGHRCCIEGLRYKRRPGMAAATDTDDARPQKRQRPDDIRGFRPIRPKPAPPQEAVSTRQTPNYMNVDGQAIECIDLTGEDNVPAGAGANVDNGAGVGTNRAGPWNGFFF
ncbi:hypothetical protein V8F20_001272 [Naviculisporaceae sp. PSN 640]